MNPHIRYAQGNLGSNLIKVNYDRKSQNNVFYSNAVKSQQRISVSYESTLSKHKSNNFDGKFYQENNFEKNYRVEPNLSMNLPMVSTNVPVKVLKTTELHKCSSANDFFNEVAAEQELVSKKPFEGNSSNQAFILKPSYQNCNLEPLQIKQNSQVKVFNNEPSTLKKPETSSEDCRKCEILKQEKEKLISFMKEQIQIASKQYTDRISKILLEQAKQIKDLKKNLINNEKCLIRFQKQAQLSKINECSPSKSISKIREKSSSKLSLTKSNHSKSPFQSNKQKICMVSKELSPVKGYSSKTQYEHGQNFGQTGGYKLTTSTTHNQYHDSSIDEMATKIKFIQEKLQQSYKMQQQKNEKILKMNKKIQVLQKGIISIFASKVKNSKRCLADYIGKGDEKINSLYKKIKEINENISFSNSKSMGNKQSYNTCSTPLISFSQNTNSQNEFNVNKILIKHKNFFSEIQELKEISETLRTKQFKYDNFQIQNLQQVIQQIQIKVFNLQKGKYQICSKIAQNEEKISKFAEMSTHLNKSYNKQTENSQLLKKSSNISGNRKKSQQLSYLTKNSPNELISSKSINNESSKVTKVTLKNNNPYALKSHSEFKGFSGQASQLSNYVDYSLYNNFKEKTQRQQYYHHEQQSFERSSEDQYENENEEQEEEEEDQFFYPLDLNSNPSYNGNSSQIIKSSSNEAKAKQYPSTTIHRLMEVIELRENRPLHIEIDQTGYIKSADNGMNIVDRNMDGFDLSKNELQWLKQRGIVILQH